MIINVFILNWNSVDSTKNCLRSVTESDDKNFRIILINNFSSESDLIGIRSIAEDYKEKVEIYLVENDSNLGYAGGNNSGLKFIEENNLSGDILILNPDIVISSNTISEMKKALTQGIGIVTVRTLNRQNKILYDAIRLRGFQQRNLITDQKSIYTDYSQGSCLMVKREIISKIGLFDERFFMYWEEVDFSLRVREYGHQLLSITSTQIIKNSNADSRHPKMFYYSVRNARLIKMKHPRLFSTASYTFYLMKILMLTAKFIGKPRLFVSVISNYLKGIYHSFTDC